VPTKLRLLVGLVTLGSLAATGIALGCWTLSPPLSTSLDVTFWVTAALVSTGSPIRLPGGTRVDVAIASVVAAAVLGGPVAAAAVGAIGTTEWRELRSLLPRRGGDVPWYGILYNHAAVVLPAVACSAAYVQMMGGHFEPSGSSLVAVVFIGTLYVSANMALTSAAIALREGRPFKAIYVSNLRQFGVSMAGLAPVAWLMAAMYVYAGPIGVLPFALPLYTTRVGYKKIVEIRDMFTQTVKSLASAVDAKDPYTAGHSVRVQIIGKELGAELGCSEEDLEALEWGGLLHDIGKIGVPDAVLLKQGDLTREERIVMNAHPVKGEEIIRPVKKLAPELPVIRHHHEWYNGSGYPDGLVGEDIPWLARILHVADSFEAMTAARPYRMTPLTDEVALGELRKWSGIQFDPLVVAAFERLMWRHPDWAHKESQRVMPPRQLRKLGQRETGAQPA
jgi:putative nucleotidyltransferase with HDIG domain